MTIAEQIFDQVSQASEDRAPEILDKRAKTVKASPQSAETYFFTYADGSVLEWESEWGSVTSETRIYEFDGCRTTERAHLAKAEPVEVLSEDGATRQVLTTADGSLYDLVSRARTEAELLFDRIVDAREDDVLDILSIPSVDAGNGVKPEIHIFTYADGSRIQWETDWGVATAATRCYEVDGRQVYLVDGLADELAAMEGDCMARTLARDVRGHTKGMAIRPTLAAIRAYLGAYADGLEEHEGMDEFEFSDESLLFLYHHPLRVSLTC